MGGERRRRIFEGGIGCLHQRRRDGRSKSRSHRVVEEGAAQRLLD
jgi:hypothetical protein